MNDDSTLSVAAFNLILFTAGQKGADTPALCRSIGLDPAVLSDPDGRLPIRKVHDLWREAITATGEPNLPLKIGEMINPLAVGVLAYVMMHCPTLGAAFEKLFHYQDIACEGIRTTGRQEDGRYFLSLHLISDQILYPDHAVNSEFSVYLSLMRALTGRSIIIEEVHFPYPKPGEVSEHERIFGSALLSFGAEVPAMVLDASWLKAPVLNANPGLFNLFEQHAADLLRKIRQPSLSGRVKEEIVQLLKGEEPTLALVADQLAMGVRTLQLHLKEEGFTYQQLLDEVRYELAVKHLREPYLSTTDIAYLLGYSEPSVFYRSFKKWTGFTPGSFRQTTVRLSA